MNTHTVLPFRSGAALYISSLLIRAAVMYFFIQPYGYYKQPDSTDYHNCAVSMAAGYGMYRIDTNEPIFWRTPGYPPYLALFYQWCGLKSAQFEQNRSAQLLAIWVQIILASFIPLILLLLAYVATQSIWIAQIVGWISVIHPGLILASTFLLTEGLALIFFYLFLLCTWSLLMRPSARPYLQSILAAASLSIYTWMRPMGEFVAWVAVLLILCAAAYPLRTRLRSAALFIILFTASLMPWYYRNYQLTGEWFFCPTIGTYLNVFNAPKILRRTIGKPLTECHAIMGQRAAQHIHAKKRALQGTGRYVSHNDCKAVSVPVCMEHPGYFLYDWMTEVIKTTCDLYAYQLITMANGSWWYDPIEEYLPDKIAACLYKEPVPLATRIVSWLELLFSLLIWIGLFGGLWRFVGGALRTRRMTQYTKLWLTAIPMIGICVGLTGGFGYARLRLPIEPLMLILSLTFWFAYCTKKNQS